MTRVILIRDQYILRKIQVRHQNELKEGHVYDTNKQECLNNNTSCLHGGSRLISAIRLLLKALVILEESSELRSSLEESDSFAQVPIEAWTCLFKMEFPESGTKK